MKSILLTFLAMGVATALLVNAYDAPAVDPAPAAPTRAAASAVDSTPTGAITRGSAEIVMKDLAYSPASLTVAPGTTVTWRNDDPMGHTVTPDDADAWGTPGSGDDFASWVQEGGTWSFTFTTPGVYTYHCLPHASKGSTGRFAGMIGTITVAADASASAPVATTSAFQMPDTSVVASPEAAPRILPDADGIVRVRLETKEVVAPLADGVAYSYWTFGGTVPGPMIRIQEGDTVEVTLANDASSTMSHSVDFHAVTGPGGGAKATQTKPGESTTFTFKALAPGVYVYHCATPHIPSHVANGMFGLIVVEPTQGWPAVDREFYVVESEWYATGDAGAAGLRSLDISKMREEDPDYFTFNGPVGALTGAGAMQAKVGETVRIFFGVGGGVPSSFHVIGEIFDDVYMDGNEAATHNRQTILVPAAGSAIVDFKVDVPGDYILVDHTLTRALDMGAAGILHVEGPADPTIFHGAETAGSGH